VSAAHDAEALSAFVDEQLDSRRRAEVEAHLKSCDACRSELAKLREVSSLVRSLPARPLPAGFMQRLQRRREAPRPAAEPKYLLPAPARYLAFAMSSVVVTVYLYDQARFMFPVVGAGSPAMLEQPQGRPAAALSADDTEHARARAEERQANSRKLARATGEPLFAGAAAPGTMESHVQDKKGPSNMELLARLEDEKKRAGIKGYYREPAEFKSIHDLNAGVHAELLKAKPLPAEVGGSVAQLLSKPEPAPAAPVRPLAAKSVRGPRFQAGRAAETAESAAALSDAEAAPKAASADASGLLLRSAAEREKAWADRGLRAAPPSVDFNANMLALVLAPDLQTAVEVIGVETRANAVVLRYRLLPRPSAVTFGRKDAALTPSYQYRLIPRTDKPVHFERAD
jgi:hypothetical protein